MQPLLNSLADVEEIKENYYDRKLISTREIERFRNELSWKYRLNKYINEPKAMFESSYELYSNVNIIFSYTAYQMKPLLQNPITSDMVNIGLVFSPY